MALLVVSLVALPFIASAAVPAKGNLQYDVSIEGSGSGSGTATATISPVGDGYELSLKLDVKASLFGIGIEVKSTTTVTYDSAGRAIGWDIEHDKGGDKARIVAKRSGDGFDLKKIEKGKTKKIRIDDGSYDRVSVDRSLWEGEVGDEIKAKLLMAGQGKIQKATIHILGREKRVVNGVETSITHFRVKTSKGKAEEWRLDDGTVVKSILDATLGKITVSLAKSK